MIWHLPANRSDGDGAFINAKASLTSEVWSPTKASWREDASGRKYAIFGTIGSLTNLFSLIFVFDYYICGKFSTFIFLISKRLISLVKMCVTETSTIFMRKI